MDSLSYVSDEYLLAQAGIDTEKFKLGKLCKRGHDWEGTGKSLRRKGTSRNCLTCSGIKDPGYKIKQQKKQENLDTRNLELANIDTKKYKLGSLCKRSHDWNNTGRTLRYFQSGKCLACNNFTEVNGDDAELLRSHGLNPELFKLGDKPCGKGHSWLNTGRSIQYRVSYSCVECSYINARKPSGTNSPDDETILLENKINPTHFFLGTLCKRQHDWRGTGRTLRYIADGVCPDCAGIIRPGETFKTIEEKFWDRVNIPKDSKNECWEWLGYKNPEGYGMLFEYFSDGSREYHLAHRLSYKIHTGEVLNGDTVIRHYKCNNPGCVSPFHILPGTYKDNSQDMVMWRRHRYGENATFVKITLDDALEIKNLYDIGCYTQDQLGQLFGISQTQVGRIIRGERWQLAIEESLVE